MRRQLLDIEDASGRARRACARPPSARSTRNARGRSCRTGSPRSAAADAGTRTWRRPRGFSRIGRPATKVVEVGHLGQHVVADDEIGLTPSPASSRAVSCRRNEPASGRPALRAALATFSAGSMPSTGKPCFDEVLQQVAVVAGELDDAALRATARSARSTISTYSAAHAPARHRSRTRNRRIRGRYRSGVTYSCTCARKQVSQTITLSG